jgi:hypothetical protein
LIAVHRAMMQYLSTQQSSWKDKLDKDSLGNTSAEKLLFHILYRAAYNESERKWAARQIKNHLPAKVWSTYFVNSKSNL